MSVQFEGRLIFPGGKRELKPFAKEMKKLRSNWVADVNWRYRKRVKFTANQWADLADDAVNILIGSDTSAVRAFIAGLDHNGVQEDVYTYLKEASRVMANYGTALYQPGGDGTRDPGDFEAEAILAKYNPPSQPPVRDANEESDRSEEPTPPILESTVKTFCTACGGRFKADDRFCGGCGKPREGV